MIIGNYRRIIFLVILYRNSRKRFGVCLGSWINNFVRGFIKLSGFEIKFKVNKEELKN